MGGISLGIGGSKGKGSSKQTSSPAQWVEDASKRGVGYAEDLFKKGYAGYGGDRVAGLSESEQQAQRMAGQNTYQPYLNQAATAFGQAGEAANTGAYTGLQNYINPYREQVLDVANRKLGREYDQSLAGLRGSATARGAFGGGRQTMLESNLKRDFLESQGDLYSKGMDQAFQTAIGASQSDLARQLQGSLGQGQGYAGLASGAANMTNDQIRALMATGESERGIRQGALDAQYEDFLRGQASEQDALDRFLASIRAGDYSRTGTGSSKESSVGFNLGFSG